MLDVVVASYGVIFAVILPVAVALCCLHLAHLGYHGVRCGKRLTRWGSPVIIKLCHCSECLSTTRTLFVHLAHMQYQPSALAVNEVMPLSCNCPPHDCPPSTPHFSCWPCVALTCKCIIRPQVVHCSPPILPPPFLHLLSRAWLIVGYAFFFPHCGIQRAFGYFLPVAGAPLIPAISATTTPMTTATDPHRCISCLCSAAAGAHTGALAVLSSENSELMARHLLEFIRPLAQPPGQSPELQAGQRNGISCWQNLRLVQEC